MKVVIRTEKLSKYYGKGSEIKAVDELDLKVHEGETFSMVRYIEHLAFVMSSR